MVHLGFFEDFNGCDTLLIEAGPDGLNEVGQVLQTLAAGRLRRLVFHKLPFLRVYGGVELRISLGKDDSGVRREGGAPTFVWECSEQGWSEAATRLTVLATGPAAAHCYLEAADDQIAVQVSKGEYGEQWWEEHGG